MDHPLHPRFDKALPGLALWLALIIVYALYLPGQNGTLHFDDEPNLSGLASVSDSQSALLFVTSGIASALSRPVSLASFLLNRWDWPDNPRRFIEVNILIHILNGALLAWLTLRVVRVARPEANQRAAWIAISAATLWLLLPILASTSLMIIQRMTSLSATFVLAGLLLYIVGLSWEIRNQRFMGRAIQFAGICFGTLLAVFAKENGALLPLYALILEITLLAGATTLSATRRWRKLLLALPVLALFGYLVIQFSPTDFTDRDFSLIERLRTQPIALWDYARLAFFPHSNAFSPFHDDYPIARGLLDPPTALIAALALSIVLGLALVNRNRFPLFALAVLWYLAGHALESSVLPLEMYFEHRNYLPLVGPMIALAWVAWPPSGSWKHKAPILLTVYAMLLGGTLWQTTTLWGQPILAAEVWASEHGDSARAVQYLAQRYHLNGDSATAHRVLAANADRYPQHIDLALEALQISCETNDESAVMRDLVRAEDALSKATYSAGALTTLYNLQDYREAKRCDSLNVEAMRRLIDGLLANEHYQQHRALHHLYHISSRLYREQRLFNGTVQQLMLAYEVAPDIGTATMIIRTLISGGLHGEAMTFLTTQRAHAPLNPILRSQWLQTLDRVQEEIANAEGNPSSQRRSDPFKSPSD